MRKCALAVFAVVVLVAGCGGGTKPEAASQSASGKPDISNVEINGDPSLPVNVLAMEAIADLQTYWGAEYPELYGEDFEPPAGGLYASTPDSESGPECAAAYGDVQGNAFYCRLDDSVAWDADDLLPDLQSRFGDFVIPVVLAHEWAHVVQARSNFTARTGPGNCRLTALRVPGRSTQRTTASSTSPMAISTLRLPASSSSETPRARTTATPPPTAAGSTG